MAKLVSQSFITLVNMYETLQVKLTNDVAVIPCSSSGVPVANAYTGAKTIVEVFMGTTKIDASKVTVTALTKSPTTVVASVDSGVTNTLSITSVPSNTTELQGYVDMTVSAIPPGKTTSTILGVYRFNFIKQLQGNTGNTGGVGPTGPVGTSYTLNISGGARGIAYSASGTVPEPTTSTAFSVTLLKNGVAITPASFAWTSGGNMSGTSTTATFTPIIAANYLTDSTFVKVIVKETVGGAEITETIPIICTKHADGLDWINNWNSQAVVLGSDKLISPKIFAGTKNASNQLTGVALGRDVLGGNSNNVIGLVGYKNNLTVFSLDQNANFMVSASGSSGAVINGTGKGIYFDGTELYLSGKVFMKSGSAIPSDATIGGTTASTVVNNASNGASAKTSIDNLKIGSRNLILESNLGVTNGDYLISTVTTSVDLVGGKVYTLVINGKSQGGQKLGVWMNGGASQLNLFGSNQDGVQYVTFTAVTPTNDSLKRKLSFYNYPSTGSAANPATIRWMALYEGDIRPSLDWTAAPEDIEQKVVTAQTTANNSGDVASAANETASNALAKIEGVTLVDGDTTVIDGGAIKTGTLTANSIAAGNFRIINSTTKETTFEVESDGNVNMWGNVQSFNFTPGVRGWRLLSNGNAEFNNSVVRSSVMLPNAGITNAYDAFESEGRNLAKYSCIAPYSTNGVTIVDNSNYVTTGTSVITRQSIANEGPIIDRYTIYEANKDYTISFKLKTISGGVSSIHIYNGCSHTNGKVYIDGVYRGTLAADVAFPVDALYHDVVITFKGGSVDRGDASTINTIHTILQPMKSVATTYSMEIKNFKIEKGATPTDWTPAPEDDPNPVRFWAGTNFESRGAAPFKVYQNGDIVVERGTFKGTVSGQLDIGKMFIDEDEISVYKYPRDTQTPNYLAVRINDASTYFNVDKFTLGSGSGVEKFSLEGEKGLLTLSNLKTIMSNSSGSELILNETTTSQFNILKTKSSFSSGGTHVFKYYTGYSGLILEATSSSSIAAGGEIPYDFKFENPTKGNAIVKVAGTLMVSDKITMRNQADVYIESKDGSDGFGKGFDIIVI